MLVPGWIRVPYFGVALVGGQVEPRAVTRLSGWWFQLFFNVHSYLGKTPILTHIYRMGLKLPTSKTLMVLMGFTNMCFFVYHLEV